MDILYKVLRERVDATTYSGAAAAAAAVSGTAYMAHIVRRRRAMDAFIMDSVQHTAQ